MNAKENQRAWLLVFLAALSLGIYVVISNLSTRFAYGSARIERPIPQVLGLFAAAFLIYLLASWLATQLPSGRAVLLLIFVPAIAFRLTMLWSEPIQEVDIYRYLWDGAVTRAGVNPFRYAPDLILKASPDAGELPSEIAQLVQLTKERPGLATALKRTHFSHVPSVYPPVSQFGFAMLDAVTPTAADIRLRINVMRCWLIFLEIATTGLVVLLLRHTELSDGWGLLHGWCPLLIKETANSGHLDALAVLLTTLAVWLTMRMLFCESKSDAQSAPGMRSLLWGCGAGIVLALAVGAKLYPAALAIWFVAACVWRLGWLRTIIPAVVLITVTWFVLRPILPDNVALRAKTPERLAPTGQGVDTFLRYWEMNDFLFLIAIENLKDTTTLPPEKTPWFSFVPNEARLAVARYGHDWLGIPPEQAPFLVSRGLLGIVFAILAVVFAWQAYNSWDGIIWLRMAFLTIAWFWLLCPTLNPWYWSWALPLLPFARSRVWWLMSGLLFAYYLRFWLKYHFPSHGVVGTPYVGLVFFDLVVTWIEFAPWFLLLIVDNWRIKWQES